MAKKNKKVIAVKKTNTPKAALGISQTTKEGKAKLLAMAKKNVNK